MVGIQPALRAKGASLSATAASGRRGTDLSLVGFGFGTIGFRTPPVDHLGYGRGHSFLRRSGTAEMKLQRAPGG